MSERDTTEIPSLQQEKKWFCSILMRCSVNNKIIMNAIITVLTTLILSLALQISSISVAQASISSQYQKTLIIGNGAESDSMNPYNSQTAVDYRISKNIFEGLLSKDSSENLIPAQAKSWELSKDGKTYTFHLRQGLKWSNGDPLTAKDFEFALRYAVDPANAQIRAKILETIHITNVSDILSGKIPAEKLGVHAIDDLTLKVTLSKPVPFALNIIEYLFVPLHRASVEKYGKQWAQPGKLVSNGAYTLDDWVVNEFVSVKKNPYYWESEKVKIEKAMFLPLQPDPELKRYKSGGMHITSTVPPLMYERIKKTMPEQVRSHPMYAVYYYNLNIKNDKLSNKSLRQALSLAIDRPLITNHVSRQGEQPAYSITPIIFNDFSPPDPPMLSAIERAEKARQLYREAGFSQEKPLELEILYNTMDSHRQIALAVSDMWKKTLGIKVKLKNQEFNSMLADARQGKFEVARMSWLTVSPEPCMMLELFKTGYTFNESGYSNPTFDSLLEDACTGIPTPEFREKRRGLFKELEQILAQDVPSIPIYFNVQNRLVKPEVGGYPPSGRIENFYLRDLYFK